MLLLFLVKLWIQQFRLHYLKLQGLILGIGFSKDGVILLLNILIGFSLWNLAISGIIGGSFFLMQYLISQGKWIGGGDIRMGLLMGISLGWPSILVALFLAYLLGSFIGIFLMMAKKLKP